MARRAPGSYTMARLFSAFDAARLLLAAVFLIGIGALGIALLGEHVFGIQPCILCLYQRVPYFISAVLAGAAAALPVSFGARRLALALCGIVFTAGAALAFYSVGVEEHWWVGVPGCDGNPTTNFTVDDIRKLSARTSSLRSCDVDVWRLFGFSLAAYNAVSQLLAAGACFLVLRWLSRRRARFKLAPIAIPTKGP